MRVALDVSPAAQGFGSGKTYTEESKKSRRDV